MKVLLAALAALFVSGPSEPPVMPPNMGLVLFANDTDTSCRTVFSLPEGGRALACASVGPSPVNRMILPNPCSPAFAGEFYAAVACHETRHWAGENHAPGSDRFADGR